MNYRAVANHIAVDFKELNLPICDEEAIRILESIGFKVINVDIISEARNLVGRSQYHRGARLSEAPAILDCSSLVKYIYGLSGIWLPRRSIQQREIGQIIDLPNRQSGDLIFCSGRIDYYKDDPADGVGHVGIISGPDTVIHAANNKVGIIESAISSFTQDGKFRDIRRIIPLQGINTFETPPNREVETSEDLRWIILQNLPKSSHKGKV